MQSVLDAGFKKYGRVIADIDTSEIVKLMDSYDMPEDVVYVAGDKKLENTQIHKVMEESIYGGFLYRQGIVMDITRNLMHWNITEVQKLILRQQI